MPAILTPYFGIRKTWVQYPRKKVIIFTILKELALHFSPFWTAEDEGVGVEAFCGGKFEQKASGIA